MLVLMMKEVEFETRPFGSPQEAFVWEQSFDPIAVRIVQRDRDTEDLLGRQVTIAGPR